MTMGVPKTSNIFMRPCLFPLLFLLLTACGGGDEADALLAAVDSLTAVKPDSALCLLQEHEADVPYWSKSQRMRGELLRARAMNKAYVDFTTDSIIKEVADYYDHHGTANEQMEAHYLLGCVYRDLGEAPRAIEAYQDAVARADTTAQDCDHALLCRIYSQMAAIFYQQNLMHDNLALLDAALHHAVLSHDSPMALNTYAHKMAAFGRLGLADSVVAICDHIIRDFYLRGEKQESARYFGLAIDSYLQRGDLEMVRRLIDAYENETGYFYSDGRIEAGREAFFWSKGMYYLNAGKIDSAEACFRMELRFGKDFENQNMAAWGLSRLYTELNIADSVAKYALYSYAMNDSAYAHMATKEVEQAKGMYDYGRHQRIAIKEREQAEASDRMVRVLVYIIISIALAFAYILESFWRKKNEAMKKHQYNLTRLRQTEIELQELKLHGDKELAKLVVSKEEEVKKLKEEIARFRKEDTLYVSDKKRSVLESSSVFQELHAKADIGKLLTDEDWIAIEQLVKEKLPEFHTFVAGKKYMFTPNEYHISLLLRLYVSPKPSSHLMGVSPSSITKLCKTILNKVFNADGSTKELKEKLFTMS